MALENLTGTDIEKFEEELLSKISDLKPIGNVTLKNQLSSLGWNEDRYWEIRNRLIEKGILQKGRGQGGSVKRVPKLPAQLPEPDESSQPVASEQGNERDLYAPMAEVIRTSWAQNLRMDAIIVEVTAMAGSKKTGGKWTRPDITVAGYRTFPYVPGKHFDLIAFEVKPSSSVDVTVIYEALGHRRAANRAYALIHLPNDRKPERQSVLEEIYSEGKRLGVGVIVAADPSDYGTWEEEVEAARHEPDPERMNEFLAQQVQQGFREHLAK